MNRSASSACSCRGSPICRLSSLARDSSGCVFATADFADFVIEFILALLRGRYSCSEYLFSCDQAQIYLPEGPEEVIYGRKSISGVPRPGDREIAENARLTFSIIDTLA